MTPPLSKVTLGSVEPSLKTHSLSSYFENMERLLKPDYVPDEQDVLRSRVQTTGIIETSFRVDKLVYR